jgi:hypothetical protein
MSDLMKEANWKCDTCGKDGGPRDGHVLLTTGRLTLGTLMAHTFCKSCDPRRSANASALSPKVVP